jgi:signal peptidase I
MGAFNDTVETARLAAAEPADIGYHRSFDSPPEGTAMTLINSRHLMIVIGGAVAALLLALAFFLIGVYVIPQNGMYPGLPAGSRILVLKHPYAAPGQVKRGDIIVFTRETDAGRFNFIWRVVGLPGDTVEAVGASLAINGRPVAQEQVRQQDGMTIFLEHAGDAVYEIAVSRSPGEAKEKDPNDGKDKDEAPPHYTVAVPPDHFVVLGDNRLEATDSRYHGLVPFAAIIGRKL